MSLSDYNVEVGEAPPVAYIYKITNRVSDKCYVGQTARVPAVRFLEHLVGNGSPLLLQDVVRQGVGDFKFEVIDTLYHSLYDVEDVEDRFIEHYDCLYPRGYNQRYNRELTPNNSGYDLNEIEVRGKYCFNADDEAVFSVGEATNARYYQILINIKEATQTKKIKRKSKFGFNYLQLSIETDRGFNVGDVIHMTLRYKFRDDTFELVE